MSTESNSTPEVELFNQLSAILGLPKNIAKLSLHFEVCHPLIAEVRFYPDASSALVVEKRFSCQLTELQAQPTQVLETGVA